MSDAPNLLNDDGTASMATMFMMAHHGLRRDLARFAVALQKVAQGDTSRVEALQKEWQTYHFALHGHHEMEDTRIFPSVATQSESLREVIERLAADHRRIDPLLGRGDKAFNELPQATAALELVTELASLLDSHLATEEETIVPLLRNAREFPVPSSDAEVELYAQGFAWSMHGIHPEVLEKVSLLLPASLVSKLPAARAAFDSRCERVWGSAAAGEARTPIPVEAARDV